jgi:hypothetical protein
MWIMKGDVLMTTNFGFDKDKKPLISFDDFLLDICILNKNTFIDMTKDMYNDELSKLPKHMKEHAIASLVKYRKNYEYYQYKHKTTPA